GEEVVAFEQLTGAVEQEREGQQPGGGGASEDQGRQGEAGENQQPAAQLDLHGKTGMQQARGAMPGVGFVAQRTPMLRQLPERQRPAQGHGQDQGRRCQGQGVPAPDDGAQAGAEQGGGAEEFAAGLGERPERPAGVDIDHDRAGDGDEGRGGGGGGG